MTVVSNSFAERPTATWTVMRMGVIQTVRMEMHAAITSDLGFLQTVKIKIVDALYMAPDSIIISAAAL